MPAPRKNKVKPGDVVGKWTVLSELDSTRSGRRFMVRCECGVEKAAWYSHLSGGTSRSCKACAAVGPPKKYPDPVPGDVLGFWTVLHAGPSVRSKSTWWCRCKCGKEKLQLEVNLTRGVSMSCGCGRKYHRMLTNLLEHADLFGPELFRQIKDKLKEAA